MLTAVIAALCMVGQDITYTIVVMAEARNRGWLAGAFDFVSWYVGIFTTAISVAALNGHNTEEKIYVLILVGLANLFGTRLAVGIGKRITGPDDVTVGQLVRRVAALEASLSEKEIQ